MNLAGLVVMVTGASSGIGLTLADILHTLGATVIGLYNNHAINKEYETYKCDVTKEENIENVIKKALTRHEKIDAVINCAAICEDNDIYEKDAESFMRVLNVNLLGTFLVCKCATKVMNEGVIINMSSTEAQDNYSILSMDYAASKAGVENLTKNLAKRFVNLKICALAPNWVDTPSVLEMEPNYLKEVMQKSGQLDLIRKENVAMKIIEMILNNDDYKNGDIVRMDKNEY